MPAPPAQARASRPALVLPQSAVDVNEEVAALAASIKGFVARIGSPLKETMRIYRSAGLASSLLELDIERMVIRTGFDGTQFSPEAAEIYQILMSHLHPKTYGSLPAEALAEVTSGCIRERPEMYLPADMRPSCLPYLERYDTLHGTALATEACEMLLRIAACAAVDKGVVPEHKRQLLAQLTAVCAVQR